MKEPRVSIIIVNWNGFEDTSECLQSIKKIDYPNYEIIVVDNGSRDNSAERIKEEFPHVILIKNKTNLGFAEGNNVGIRYALSSSVDYLFILNNDTVVDPKVLSVLVEVGERDPSIGVLGSKVYNFNKPKVLCFAGSKINWETGIAQHTGMNEEDSGQYDKTTEVDRLSGCAMIIKRKVIEDIGCFDRRFFLYYEETDLCNRARQFGYKIVFVPDSIIWHKVSRSAGGEKSPLMTYYLARNRLLFLRKNNKLSFKIHFQNLLILVKSLIVLVLNINKEQERLPMVRGIMDFYLKRFGRRYSTIQ